MKTEEEKKKGRYRGLKPFKPGETGSLKRYRTPEALQTAIKNYFTERDQEKKPYTVTGLARSLGFKSRIALLQYQKAPGYEAYHDIVINAKMRIEEQCEEMLMTRQSVAGTIFNLKNNWGWQDAYTLEAKQGNQDNYDNLSTDEKTELFKLLNKAKK